MATPKGKSVKRYRHADVKTPLECPAQLAAAKLVTFKADVTLAGLHTDLAAAQAMQRAKSDLFANSAKPGRRD